MPPEGSSHLSLINHGSDPFWCYLSSLTWCPRPSLWNSFINCSFWLSLFLTWSFFFPVMLLLYFIVSLSFFFSFAECMWVSCFYSSLIFLLSTDHLPSMNMALCNYSLSPHLSFLLFFCISFLKNKIKINWNRSFFSALLLVISETNQVKCTILRG